VQEVFDDFGGGGIGNRINRYELFRVHGCLLRVY
jgi:hypothetical protein